MKQEERLPTPTHYQSEEEYHSESEQSSIPPNLNNNLLLNMTFDANIAQALMLALTNLNMTFAGGGRENKSVS